jgi:Fe-S-cluster-containing dehydrogenase component
MSSIEINSEKQDNGQNEFSQSESLLAHPADRRDFLKMMGATAAFAGLTGCQGIRKPTRHITPYAKQPEYLVVGKGTYYATAYKEGDSVHGLLIESYEGRPTKVEGNPSHSMSLGSANARHQASVLNLYDPDRVKTVLNKGAASNQKEFSTWLKASGSLKRAGLGVALLIEEQASPTNERLLEAIITKYPKIQIYQYEPINRDAQRNGLLEASGKNIVPFVDFEKADIIASFGSDFLGLELDRLGDAKTFASRRDPDGSTSLNRTYVFESAYSITGGSADHRYPVSTDGLKKALYSLAAILIERNKVDAQRILGDDLIATINAYARARISEVDPKVVTALADDLLAHKGNSAILIGRYLPASLHALAYSLNALLKNDLAAVAYRSQVINSWQKDSNINGLKQFIQSATRGGVKQLFILGGNPVYNAPADLNITQVLDKIDNITHLTSHLNDTSAKSHWVVPRSHYLEMWGDARAIDGSISIIQPVIRPLYDSLSDTEFMLQLLANRKSAFTVVRETHTGVFGSTAKWPKWLHEGVVSGPIAAQRKLKLHLNTIKALIESDDVISAPASNQLTLMLQADSSIYDGRYINNAWLQELPNSITKLTWDNALLISPSLAKSMNLHTEDVVKVKTQSGEIEAPIFIAQGQANSMVYLSLGYGQATSGRIGSKSGVNGYKLMGSRTGFLSPGVTLSLTKKSYPLASSQKEESLHDRPMYREGTISEYKSEPAMFEEMVEHPPLKSMWVEPKYDTGNQWGMTIDLNKCTGCNACVVACQSENNIPVVGKRQVKKGRIMHWIRMDRYFKGDSKNPDLLLQPVACMQCENAPCEQVCPVAATVHDNEGLNAMVYNRCIGTRYCSNNCPYKVRRFNFFDWHQRSPQAEQKTRVHFFDYMKEPAKTVQMQMNPDVTVRMRGVMEKCTYCTQRIQEVKIQAANETRDIRDGEIKTACQQTCPTGAIEFGNILDKNSTVSKERNRKRKYAMLAELNTKPRTLYLASVKNPNSLLVERGELSNHEHH